MDVRILPVVEEDIPRVANFLCKYFFPDEPLNSSLQRCPAPEDIPFIDIIKEGLSFKAVNVLDNSEDNLVGAALNKEASLSKKKKSSEITCPKRMKIGKLLDELDERAKIWEAVNEENHFNILSVSVSNRCRGQRIGQRLVEESLKLAKSKGFRFATIECSSFYSARFAVEMGFELLAEIPYEEYLDENQVPVFDIKKPHVAIKKLIKRL